MVLWGVLCAFNIRMGCVKCDTGCVEMCEGVTVEKKWLPHLYQIGKE